MKRKFTTVTRVFRLFADIFDLNAILPKLVYFFSTIMNTLVFAPLCTSCNEASFLLILGYVALADLEINLLKKKFACQSKLLHIHVWWKVVFRIFFAHLLPYFTALKLHTVFSDSKCTFVIWNYLMGPCVLLVPMRGADFLIRHNILRQLRWNFWEIFRQLIYLKKFQEIPLIYQFFCDVAKSIKFLSKIPIVEWRSYD